MSTRLDKALVERGLVSTRSQASDLILRGKVTLNNKVVQKPHITTSVNDRVEVNQPQKYVSRAGYKLASVADSLKLTFKDKIVLDVGSSTGGFTDYAIRHGAAKVIAVDVGTQQLHASLRAHPRIELHEKTDIRDFETSQRIDLVMIDVSFISIRDIWSAIHSLVNSDTKIIAMVKPQFETTKESAHKHKGVIKNDTIRRSILKDFEIWMKQYCVIEAKADSALSGSKGNLERFYLLRPLNMT